jgi:hypothetical protein
MGSHVSIACRTSAGLHAAAIAAGLALSNWASPVHVHMLRGEVTLAASFATAASDVSELPPIEI